MQNLFSDKLVLRLIHIENLPILLKRNGLHAPNFIPPDQLRYRTIHDIEVQKKREQRIIPCGPRGSLHDYIPFYFGPLSPMLLQLHSKKVKGYEEGQPPLLYLVTNVQEVLQQQLKFVFSDGHGIQKITKWFHDLDDLDKVDWNLVKERYWSDQEKDRDRQRRKQAEFLVHQYCDWSVIQGIAVYDEEAKMKVEKIFEQFPISQRKKVKIKTIEYG